MEHPCDMTFDRPGTSNGPTGHSIGVGPHAAKAELGYKTDGL